MRPAVSGPVPGAQGPGPPGAEDQRTRGAGPGADDETHHAFALKRGGGHRKFRNVEPISLGH